MASARENAARYLAARSAEVAGQADGTETANLSIVETNPTPSPTSGA